MEIIFIGTGVGVPSLRRASPSILVREKEDSPFFLLDSGPGTLRKLLEAGFTYQNINVIFYTHFHTDHISDLPAFLFASKNPLDPKRAPLTLIGPKGLKNFYDGLINLYGDQLISSSYTVRINEMTEGKAITIDGWKVTSKPMVHTEHSIAYRIEDSKGKVLVYSGDTEFNQGIIELARDSDLLILECSFPNIIKTEGHLTPQDAGSIAKKANCKKLILTHLYPICQDYDILSECKEIFNGDVQVAEDLMKVSI